MTICSAGISKEGIVLISDCRVTYDNIFSDSLLKTYSLTQETALSFSGNINCAKFIITRLNGKHLHLLAKKGSYSLLKHTSKQIKRLYKTYLKTNKDCFVSFLLTGCSGNNYWVGECNSPKFEMNLTNKLFSARTIGDTSEARKAVNKSMVDSVKSNFTGRDLVMLASSSINAALNLVYYDDFKDRDKEHGVSGLHTLFKLTSNGLQIFEQDIEMFRGRIADRNKPLGHAKTNSVRFDNDAGKFRIYNHQTGKSNILSDVYSFAGQQRGIVNTNFNPYKLKG